MSTSIATSGGTMRKRLRMFFWAMLVVVAAVTSILLVTQYWLQRDTLHLQDQALPHWQAAQRLNTDTQMLSAQAMRLPLALSLGELDTIRDRVDSQFVLLEADLAGVIEFDGSDRHSAALALAVQDVRRSIDSIMLVTRERLALTAAGSAVAEAYPAIMVLRRRERDLAQVLEHEAVKLTNYASSLAAEVNQQLLRQRDEYHRKLWLQTLFVALAGLFLGGLLLAQYRMLNRHLLGRIDALRRTMAEGVVDARLLDGGGRGDELHAMQFELARLLQRLQRQNDALERLATTDELTTLVNRRRLFERLDEEVTRSRRYDKPLSVILIDIDHFKKVNDTWGHSVGDQVLRATARSLLALSRETDVVARYGGEEFVIVLPETDRRGAVTAAASLCSKTAQVSTVLPNGRAISITISLGVATLRNGESAEALMIRADAALYAAKRNGRNRVEIAA